MILPKGHSTRYLTDLRDGKVEMGLPIGCDKLDSHIRFKRRQLNLILGHDNVGKTHWINWYFLVLAAKHNLKIAIWSGENRAGNIMRDMIQMYSGIHFDSLHHEEIRRYEAVIEHMFDFVDNKYLYKPMDLLDIFRKTDADICLIDPFTGLDREFTHAGNYQFLNSARQFVNETGKSLYINTHPTSESGRSSMIYPVKHDWEGHLKPPLKDHVEGGKPFINRVDDVIVIHRLVKHEMMKYITMVSVEKVKDQATGGRVTGLNDPILCEFNSGLGFKIESVDPMPRKKKDVQAPKEPQKTTINGWEHSDFDQQVDMLFKEGDPTDSGIIDKLPF